MIWRGAGWMVPALSFLVLILLQLVVEATGGNYTESDFWPGFGIGIAGFVNYVAGKHFNREPERASMDEQMSEQMGPRKRHDFWFIRMEWWGVALAVGGVALIGYRTFT